jgi:hypothetical protein
MSPLEGRTDVPRKRYEFDPLADTFVAESQKMAGSYSELARQRLMRFEGSWPGCYV